MSSGDGTITIDDELQSLLLQGLSITEFINEVEIALLRLRISLLLTDKEEESLRNRLKRIVDVLKQNQELEPAHARG